MKGRDRIIEACERGGSTIFGSGLNPGFIQLFAIVSAGLSDRVDRVRIIESFDTTIYDSPETEKIMGFGYPIDHPGLLAVTEEGSGIFREAVLVVAEALGAELDEIRCEADYAQAPRTSTCRATGSSKRAASQASTCGGRGTSASATWSRYVRCGPRARRWIRCGRWASATT